MVLKPQLFLVKTYQLSNFRAGLLRDEMMVATMQPMLPHQKITCRVLRQKRTTQEEKQGSTVLDAQSTETAASFNNHVAKSSEEKFGAEQYKCAMQSNLNGRGSAGLGSVLVKAHLDTAGSTNDVR